MAGGLAKNSPRCRNFILRSPIRGGCCCKLLTLSTLMYVGGVMVGVTNNLVSALADFSERYDQVMHAVSREVSRQGYTPAEGRIIEILGGRILSQAYLRTRTHIERGQLSRAINNLISKGFVERSRGLSTSWPVYRLTETGLDQHHRVNRARHDAIKAILKKMLRPDRMAMINAMEKLGIQVNRQTENMVPSDMVT